MAAIEIEPRRPVGMRRRLSLLTAVATLALSGTVALAPPAGATDYSCDYGDVCVLLWDGGNVVYDSPHGLWEPMDSGADSFVLWNNGMPWWGADHIQATFTTANVPGYWWTCLHYGPLQYQNAGQPTAIQLPRRTTLWSLSWRGECAPEEEGYHPVLYY